MNAHARLVHDYEAGIGVPASEITHSPDPGSNLAATLPVWSLAAGSVAAVAAAANRLRDAHGLAPVPHRIDPERITAAFSSDSLLRANGRPVSMFADLSGFFPTFDGWVRTHANYPHHRTRLLAALGLPEDAPLDLAIAHIAMSRASDIEDNAAAAGAIAVQVRTEDEWAASPQAHAAASGPVVAMEPRQDRAGAQFRSDATPFQPLRGVRVLDMTRVIAGPVATRTLALLGAEVLRVDPPWLPEIPWQYADTCQGKHSAVVDLRAQSAVFHDLLASADVLVSGYRPGALEHAGLTTAVRPGLVHGRVSAWGESGPWGARRGFDSIVQAATGISILEGAPSVPGALPAQALDHASGYLLAAGVIDALAARTYDGIGRDVRVSLARTASWLLTHPARTLQHSPATAPNPELTVRHGALVTAAPALAEYPDYAWPAPQFGAGSPAWPVRTR
ncbi:CoA transferase [Nocardia amikacinitolerans]|uniref:CoA transferase n=1 Tax=Nocardia amikacinitolerans TaxID=756689 RepID=UPI0020A3CF0D|nr:CoA transferase [Nocardia amikacinitolerans]MCP2275797.1 CoA-transferase family III [Nocardia amikacinitolerans]MCP2294068.1 CoA-transferase family III [Nocardia amikacinitolerans]